jgi:hypothetical protein
MAVWVNGLVCLAPCLLTGGRVVQWYIGVLHGAGAGCTLPLLSRKMFAGEQASTLRHVD